MHQSAPAKLRYSASVVLALAAWGLIQGVALLNWQLQSKAPGLFPVLKFNDVASMVGDVLLILVAGAYLISKSDQIRSLEWWVGFVAMQIPYMYLKGVGVYYDQTQYLIAAAEGRHIGGGAAMGHLLLVFYSMGPAAGLSWAAFGTTRWLRKIK